MKKVLSLLLCILLMTGCQEENEEKNIIFYNEMIDILHNAKDYAETSEYYSISFEKTFTKDGERYYIVIDNPRIAMYDVNILAFGEDTDTENEFVPNAGIFEGSINMIPNQINKDKGFVKGVSISGVLDDANVPVYCLVQWKDELRSQTFREYFVLNNNLWLLYE